MWEEITASEFAEVHKNAGVGQIVSMLLDSTSPHYELKRKRLQSIVTFRRKKLQDAKSLEDLWNMYLVWVGSVDFDPSEWNLWPIFGSRNLKVRECGAMIADGTVEHQGILSIKESLQHGLTQPINFVVSHDTSLHRKLVVDGNHRAVACWLIWKENPADLLKLLGSLHGIYIYELRSKWAHIFYNCDFLSFIEEKETRN